MEVKKYTLHGHSIISFTGFLSFENTSKICRELREFFSQDKANYVIFDFSKLEFVGSSGVSSFVKVLSEFNVHKPGPVYWGVREEFIKLFALYTQHGPFNVQNHLPLDLLAKTQLTAINLAD